MGLWDAGDHVKFIVWLFAWIKNDHNGYIFIPGVQFITLKLSDSCKSCLGDHTTTTTLIFIWRLYFCSPLIDCVPCPQNHQWVYDEGGLIFQLNACI